MANRITFAAFHHSGSTANDPYAKSQHLTAADVNFAHYLKYQNYESTWPAFKSPKGFFGGYNFFYEKDGKRTQFRPIGFETAAQKGYNLDTVSFCFAGNFSYYPGSRTPIESPTPEQITSAKLDFEAIITGTYGARNIDVMPGTVIDILIQNVHPHRWFGFTECNGTSLPNDWARKTIVLPLLSDSLSLSQKSLNLFFRLNDMLKVIKLQGVSRLFGFRKFGALQRSCCVEQVEKG